MNIIDIAVLIILSLGLINGFIKGFINEVAGIISIVLGIIGSIKFAEVLEVNLGLYIEWDPRIILALSFIILFIIIVYSISLLAKMITKTLKIIALGMLNRILGGFFGFIKWSIILSVLVIVSHGINDIITILPDKVLNESLSYNLLDRLGDFLFSWVMKSKSIQQQQFFY
tara:strand:+ start:2492 stop:3004 length:513 start_codon:yes stop_codon:yes gene_type:complete